MGTCGRLQGGALCRATQQMGMKTAVLNKESCKSCSLQVLQSCSLPCSMILTCLFGRQRRPLSWVQDAGTPHQACKHGQQTVAKSSRMTS